MTSRQWSQDFELKTAQERVGQYADALKAISGKGAPAISGIGSLANLALKDPAGYQSQVHGVLSALVRQQATKSSMALSGECNDELGSQYSRSEALPEVQAAMTALGNRRFASYRDRFVASACESASSDDSDLILLSLDHRYLDELDLGRRDFSCAGMSQAQLHRVNFRDAILRGTDFRGARIADFETPGFDKAGITDNLYEPDKPGGVAEWARYRCWVTDFRNADLTGANFEGAAVDGADFRGADLTGANFCCADVSRANFTDAKGLTMEMLFDTACVGKFIDSSLDEAAQPVGLNFKISRCYPNKKCPAAEPKSIERLYPHPLHQRRDVPGPAQD
jgi:uncharacterized protein YjbI with pentapeptide repeats